MRNISGQYLFIFDCAVFFWEQILLNECLEIVHFVQSVAWSIDILKNSGFLLSILVQISLDVKVSCSLHLLCAVEPGHESWKIND